MRLTAVSSVDVDGVLLLLKIGFLGLLYLFIWRIVRTASKDLRLPQESFILGPQQAEAVGLGKRSSPPSMGRLVVVSSPALEEQSEYVLDSTGITIGRGSQTHESSFRRRLRPGWEMPVERPIFIGRSGSRFLLPARDLPESACVDVTA